MQTNLLPIGTRVTHFDGGPHTHGHGTIIAYNDRRPNEYYQKNPIGAAQLAGSAGLLGGLIESVYDGVRCPYKVRWDSSPVFFERHPHLAETFPSMQYEDMYEHDSINPIKSQMSKVGMFMGMTGSGNRGVGL